MGWRFGLRPSIHRWGGQPKHRSVSWKPDGDCDDCTSGYVEWPRRAAHHTRGPLWRLRCGVHTDASRLWPTAIASSSTAAPFALYTRPIDITEQSATLSPSISHPAAIASSTTTRNFFALIFAAPTFAAPTGALPGALPPVEPIALYTRPISPTVSPSASKFALSCRPAVSSAPIPLHSGAAILELFFAWHRADHWNRCYWIMSPPPWCIARSPTPRLRVLQGVGKALLELQSESKPHGGPRGLQPSLASPFQEPNVRRLRSSATWRLLAGRVPVRTRQLRDVRAIPFRRSDRAIRPPH
mmetsp:Transcript_25786/g.56530  ORF Transcript_25786/g.56530 Transcript_25786/m.56530 type:complete len:299 (-) Transcript_25786:751-1647(-)